MLVFFTISGLVQSRNLHTQQVLEENRQAIVLFAIVILFFVGHLPRNFLNIHEAATFEQKKKDYLNGCNGMPLWILIIGLISHMLLACNSALNFVLYCAMSDLFRTELCVLSKSWINRFKKKFTSTLANQQVITRPQNTQHGQVFEMTLV